MTLEAIEAFKWPIQGIGRRLKTNFSQIGALSKFRKALTEIVAFGVNVVAVDPQDVIEAADFRCQFGLLSGDALIVSIMRKHSIVNIASHDGDFDRVPGLVRFAPI